MYDVKNTIFFPSISHHLKVTAVNGWMLTPPDCFLYLYLNPMGITRFCNLHFPLGQYTVVVFLRY